MTDAAALIVADPVAAQRWLQDAVAQGRQQRVIDELPPDPWDLSDRRWAATARPVDVDEIGTVVEAVLRGVAVAIVAPPDTAAAELLADELGRALGPSATPPPGSPSPTAQSAPPAVAGLAPDTLELLVVLGGGASIAEAAAAVHVSLRTAERRIAAARRTLGVRSTAEAVVAVMGTGA
jgi:DNA-binding NarL/FixJ family response regulator